MQDYRATRLRFTTPMFQLRESSDQPEDEGPIGGHRNLDFKGKLHP